MNTYNIISEYLYSNDTFHCHQHVKKGQSVGFIHDHDLFPDINLVNREKKLIPVWKRSFTYKSVKF